MYGLACPLQGGRFISVFVFCCCCWFSVVESVKFKTQLYWQGTSRGHNTVTNLRTAERRQRPSGWVAPVPKCVGRSSDQVSSPRPYHRPRRQVLCGSVVPSTESIGRIRIGPTIRSYHQPGRGVVASTKLMGRTIDQVHRSYHRPRR